MKKYFAILMGLVCVPKRKMKAKVMERFMKQVWACREICDVHKNLSLVVSLTVVKRIYFMRSMFFVDFCFGSWHTMIIYLASKLEFFSMQPDTLVAFVQASQTVTTSSFPPFWRGIGVLPNDELSYAFWKCCAIIEK